MLLIETAAKTLPVEPQLRCLQEECAELIFTINKYFRRKKGPEDIIEECVDVSLFIEQMRYYFPSPRWEQVRAIKLQRLEEIVSRAVNRKE